MSAAQIHRGEIKQPFNDAYLAQHTFDERRIEALRGAIVREVQKGDVVADLGSGQGFLGVFAALCGARVYCVEIDEGHAAYIEWLAKINGVADRIRVIQEDATEVQLPESVDVIISEIISAGFWYEPQLQVLRRNLPMLKPGGSLIPEGMTTKVQLIHAQTRLYGLQLPPVTRWTDLDEDRIMTDTQPYNTVDFSNVETFFANPRTERIVGSTLLHATVSGVANAIRTPYDIFVRYDRPGDPGIIYSEASSTWGNPQIVFLEDSVELVAGEHYRVGLEYGASAHPDTSTLRVDHVPEVPLL